MFLSIAIVLHSPLFVAREIAIRLSRHVGGARRALRFMLGTAAVIAATEALFGFTPLGRLVAGAFASDPVVVEGAHHAFRIIWPTPFVIAIRGVSQAHQIRSDDTLYVGLGTVVRLGVTAVIGFGVAPHLGISGPVLGGLCVAFGIMVEAVVTVLRTRHVDLAEPDLDGDGPSALAFAIPLMFANSLGLLAALFFLRVAGEVPAAAQEDSLAAYQEVKSVHWLLASGAFALQSLTTAKVRREEDQGPMMRFALVVGGGLTVVLAALAFTPLRDWLLVDVMGEKAGGDVVRYAGPAFMLAAPMPLLTAIRFSLRGILISRGRSRPITLCNMVTLLIIATALAFDWRVSERNGALNAYVLWVSALVVELALLGRAAFGPGSRDEIVASPPRPPREATGG